MNRIEAVIGGMKMARKLTWPEAEARGRGLERKAIRKAIAPALRELRGVGLLLAGRTEFEAMRTAVAAIETIDRATRRARAKGKRP